MPCSYFHTLPCFECFIYCNHKCFRSIKPKRFCCLTLVDTPVATHPYQPSCFDGCVRNFLQSLPSHQAASFPLLPSHAMTPYRNLFQQEHEWNTCIFVIATRFVNRFYFAICKVRCKPTFSFQEQVGFFTTFPNVPRVITWSFPRRDPKLLNILTGTPRLSRYSPAGDAALICPAGEIWSVVTESPTLQSTRTLSIL